MVSYKITVLPPEDTAHVTAQNYLQCYLVVQKLNQTDREKHGSFIIAQSLISFPCKHVKTINL